MKLYEIVRAYRGPVVVIDNSMSVSEACDPCDFNPNSIVERMSMGDDGKLVVCVKYRENPRDIINKMRVQASIEDATGEHKLSLVLKDYADQFERSIEILGKDDEP